MNRPDGIWQAIGKQGKRKQAEKDVAGLLKQIDLFEDLSDRDLRHIVQTAYRGPNR